MTFEEAVADFPMDAINTKFPNGTYSPWALVEHIRIAQWDILDYIQNKNYQEMQWPEDYWPDSEKKATEKDWNHTIQQFKNDQGVLAQIVENSVIDLSAPIPHTKSATVLGEILLVTDHNAYHIGEFAIIRQVMGTWRNHS